MPKPKHIPQAAWDKAIELLETAPAKWRRSISSGIYIRPNGNLGSGYLGGDVCHGFMEYGSAEDSVLFFNTMKKRTGELETAVRSFCNWAKKASPFRNFILNDDVETMIHGGLIIDVTRTTSNLALFICKIFRCAYEDTWRIPVWYELTKRGVHPMIALVVSQNVNSKYRKSYGTHNTCMCDFLPKNQKDMDVLKVDHLPDGNLDQGDWTTSKVFPVSTGGPSVIPIPDAKGAKRRVPDGWGGYTEETVPFDLDLFAKQLIEVQKEYGFEC